MGEEVDLGVRAPLRAYLEIAQGFYHEDRLDAAMQVVEDALDERGWPEGQWTEFLNKLTCENDTRSSAFFHRIDDELTIELGRDASPLVYKVVESASLDARRRVAELLGVTGARKVMVTVFRSDAPVDFIIGSFGYVSHKADLDKICVPWHTAESREVAAETMLHEFLHVGAYELAGENVPLWVNEGLATYLSGELQDLRSSLRTSAALRWEELLSVNRLEGALESPDLRMSDRAKVQAAYYLSGTLLSWWVGHYGLPSVRAALTLMGRGYTPAKAIRRTASVPLRLMEREWRDNMRSTGGDGVR